MLRGFCEKDRLFLFDVIQKSIGIAVMLILCLEVMHLMGVSPAVLVTVGRVGAIALAFGAKGIVSSSLSDLSLYINRCFVVSDFIDILSKNLSGNVEHIGAFMPNCAPLIASQCTYQTASLRVSQLLILLI